MTCTGGCGIRCSGVVGKGPDETSDIAGSVLLLALQQRSADAGTVGDGGRGCAQLALRERHGRLNSINACTCTCILSKKRADVKGPQSRCRVIQSFKPRKA